MRGVFLAAVVAGLVLGGVAAGVRAVVHESSSTAGPGAVRPGPGATAEAFAAAWRAGDTAALYALLAPAAREAFGEDAFAAAYSGFMAETTATGLDASVASAGADSATLAVRLATRYFGTLEYNVTLPMVPVPGGWGVTWDPAVIHPRLAGGHEFKSDIERPRRGSILDRNGLPLAVTREVRMLGLNRAVVADRGSLTAALVDFGFTREQVDAAFESGIGLNQRVPLGPVGEEAKEAAAALIRIPGVLVYFESQRVHPLGPAAAHVVGYTRELTAEELAERRGQGFRPGDRVGATGIEASMEPVLAGHTGATLRLADASGQTVETLFDIPFAAGQDVTTTLDANVLVATYARLGGRAGAAVVLDPRTNAVLALVSLPSFDPGAFERNDRAALEAIVAAPGSPLANRASTGLYSGGSTFKLVTGAAGLASGLFRPAGQIECGSIWRGVDPPRRNWEGSQGLLTIAEALMRSCNPVFYEIALTLHNEAKGALPAMARAFGYGAPTGIVGLDEEAGLVPDAEWKAAARGQIWYPGDEVNLGIGQGDLLITPLQLANAYSTFVARELRAPVLLASEIAVSRGALPIDSASWSHLSLGLQLVTGVHGTASVAFANAGYTNFAGKSGTAEDAGSQQHVLFVAYAPAGAPRALAAVVLDEGQSGSGEAGPMARDMVLAALR